MATVNTINDLPALGRTPTSGDKLALQPQGDNTKSIDYDALATAIINKLGGDPVTIAHGGTGGATAAAARTNLEAAASIDITGSTWAAVYTPLSKLTASRPACVSIGGNSMSLLTGGTETYAATGTAKLVNANAGIYEFFVTSGINQCVYSWRITGLLSASDTPTIGTVYAYSPDVTARTTYTPTIAASGNSTFAVSNVSFGYYVSGNVIRVSGRFQVSNIGTGNGGISVSLPGSNKAIAFSVGPCGYCMYGSTFGQIRAGSTAASTTVSLFSSAGSSVLTPSTVGANGIVSVDFTVPLA